MSQQLAIDEAKKAAPTAQSIVVDQTIQNFLGGTIYVVTVKRGSKYDEWSVLVKDGKAQLFQVWTDVFSEVSRYQARRRIFDVLVSQQATITIISLIIIICSLAEFMVYPASTAAQYIQSPLSMVLGFWFGRGTA